MTPPIQSHSTYVKLLAVAAGCLLFQCAQATLLFEDGFNYATGGLNGTDVSPAGMSGNAWSSGSANITVASGNLTYSGLLDLGGNEVKDNWGVSAGSVVNTYTAQTSGTIYYSFLIDCTAAPTASTYLTSLNPGTGAPNGSSDALQVNVTPSGTGFKVGLRTAGQSITSASTVLSLNTTYMVVAEYSFSGTGTASLYLDPTPGGSQPTTPDVTLAGNSTVTSIADVGFKAQSSTTSSGTFLLDNLFVGTTWGDVTQVAAAPEPSIFALAGLGLCGLGWRFRRGRP